MFPRLETERLLLTVPRPEHVPALIDYAVRNREHLARFGPPEPPDAQSAEFWQKRVASIARDFETQQGFRFSVWHRAEPDGRIIGGVSLTGIVWSAMRGCFMGYHLDEAEQGKGMMSEAVRAVIRYGFDELKLHRIAANYMPTNERSGRLLKRLGFAVEGYARDYLFTGGGWSDHVLTALVNHELRELPGS